MSGQLGAVLDFARVTDRVFRYLERRRNPILRIPARLKQLLQSHRLELIDLSRLVPSEWDWDTPKSERRRFHSEITGHL